MCEEKNVEIEKAQKLKRDKELNDLKVVLKNAEGRRFLWRVMAVAGVFREAFTGNSETYFNLGKSNIGRYILNEILAVNPDAFVQMQREFKSENKDKEE